MPSPARPAKKPAPAKKAAKPPAAAPKRARKAASAKTSKKLSPREAALAKVRALCEAFPEVGEEPFGVHVTFRVRKKVFAYFLDNHHGDGRLAVWCKAAPGAQGMLVDGEPERFFVPPYVGPRGWVGARLEGSPDWAVIGACLEEAYEMTAPKRLRRGP